MGLDRIAAMVGAVDGGMTTPRAARKGLAGSGRGEGVATVRPAAEAQGLPDRNLAQYGP